MARTKYPILALACIVFISSIGGYLVHRYRKQGRQNGSTKNQSTREVLNPQLTVQVGHTGEVNCVAFSPDGKFLVSGDSIGLVILWDVAAGAEIREFVGHTSPVSALAFSRDGRYLVTGSGDELPEDEGTANLDTSVRVWDIFSGAELHRFTYNKEPITSVQFSQDDQRVLSASAERVRILDVKSGNVSGEFGSAGSPINVARFSPDGSFVVLARGGVDVVSLEKNRGKFGVEVWEISTGKLSHRLDDPRNRIRHPIGYLAFSPDGRYLATGAKNPLIVDDVYEGVRVWDFEARKLLKTWKADVEGVSPDYHESFYGPVGFSANDGNSLVAGGQITTTIDAGAYAVFQLNLPHGTTTRFRTAEELRVAGKRKTSLPELGITTAIDVSPDQNYVAVAANPQWHGGTSGNIEGETTLRIFDLKDKTEIRQLTGNKTRLAEIKSSPDGRILSAFKERSWPYPAHDPAGGYVWDTKTGFQLNLNTPGTEIAKEFLLAVSSDGSSAITGTETGSTLWDVVTQNVISRLPSVQAAWFSADNSKVLTWGGAPGTTAGPEGPEIDATDVDVYSEVPDTRVTLLDAKSGRKLWNYDYVQISGPMSYVRDLGATPIHFDCALSPDGKYVTINDGVVKLLDGRTGKIIRPFDLTEWNASNGLLTFSPNSKYLLIGLPEELICVDVASGRKRWGFGLRVARELDFQTYFLAFAPDGRFVALGGESFSRNDRSPGLQEAAIKILELNSGKEFWHLKDQSTFGFAFSSDSRELVTIDPAGLKLSVWNIASHTLVKTIPSTVNDRIISVNFGKDSQTLLVGGLGGKIRLIDKQTGRELCTLISFPDGTWVVVTSDGRFDTNNLEAIQGLHWIFPDEPMKLLPLDIFLRQYYEPRLLVKILNRTLQPIPPVGSLNRTQPKIEITNITEPDSDARVQVTVSAWNVTSNNQQDENGQPLQSGVFDVRLFRDGQLVGYSIPPWTDESPKVPVNDELVSWRDRNRVPLSEGKYERTFSVQLPHREDLKQVEFSAYGFNSDRVKSATVKAVLTLRAPPVARKGRAYVIAVGVNAHESEKLDLSFAANDARVFKNSITTELLETQSFESVVGVSLVSDYATIDESSKEARVKRKTSPRSITDTQATKQNLKYLLNRLAGRPASGPVSVDVQNLVAVNPDDIVIIFFSGHGYTDDRGIFYFLPYDTGEITTDDFENTSLGDDVLSRFVSSSELAEWMKDIDAGEIVVVIDACFAAASVESAEFKPGPLGSRGLGQLAYDKGMRVLVASQANERALDSGELRQGVLTYCLIQEGIKGAQADYKPKDKVISLEEWLEFPVSRVPKLRDEISKGSVQAFGKGSTSPTVISSVVTGSPTNNSQQASLFDFKRKKRPIIMADLKLK